MGEVFTTSGENSENIVVPTPRLQGLFVPGIDNPLAIDGFGIVTPWGGGGTSRKYSDYGISGDISRQNTQLNDLASSLIPAEGAGISYNWEGLVGPQGIPGRDGRDGIIHIMGLNLPQNSNFLAELPHNIDQINDLGTAVDKLIYTNAYNTYTENVWTERQPAGDATGYWTAIASDSDGSNLIAADYGGRLWTSSDSGVTWTERRPAGDANKDWRCVASDSDGSHLIVGINNGRLYTSANSGVDWTERKPAGETNHPWISVASDADGSNLIACGYNGRLYTSANSGVDWTERSSASNKLWSSVASNSTGTNLIVALKGGTIYTSVNGGTDWTARYPAGAGSKNWEEVASDSDGSFLMASKETTTALFISTDSGVNWTERVPDVGASTDSYRVACDSDGSHCIASNGSSTYTSSNSGVNWTTEDSEDWGDGGIATDDDGSNLMSGGSLGRLYTKATATLYSEATWAEAALTSAGRAILDDANAPAQATTLGLGTGDSPTFAGTTLTNAAVIGSNSVVFQPATDSTTFFQVLDADGGTPIFNVDTTNERVGIGTNTPDSIFHIKANVAGTVGSHPAGQLIIQDPDDTVFGNAVITGYESDSAGNPDQQLWYLGSSSSSNSAIIFLNRRNSKLQLGTNGVSQLTILGDGKVGIGITSPKTKLTIEGTLTLKEQAAADGDTAAYGQVWCKDDVPNTLWFVNDLGTEIRIAPQDLQTSASPTFNQVLLGIDPTNVSHSVTKSYADALVAGAFWEDVTVGTVANVDLSNGLETGDTIDDYVLVEDDRVLVKEQTDQTENGLYAVPASGAASRTADADTAAEIEGKKCIPLNGSLTKHRFYFCITGNITLGVTDIKFAEVTMMTAHNTLSGLQGGQADQYYHLTSAEHTAVGALGATYQPLDTGLTSLAALSYSAASFVKMTGANTFALRTLQQTSDDLEATIDHDNLLNFAANEHFLQSAITEVGTIATGVWEGTSIGVGYTDAKCTDANADETAVNETSHALVLVDGDFGSAGLMNTDGAGTYSIKAIGTDVQAFHANLAAIAGGTWIGAASITTLGTIATVGAITGQSTAAFEGASVTVGKASTTTGTLILHDSGSANTITLTVPDSLAGSLSFTLPPTDGADTNILQTNGSGVLTWTAVGAVAFGRPIILTPQCSCGPASNFATLDTIAGGSTPNEVVSVLDFDPDATEYADFKIDLPPGYAGGGITATVKFSMTSDHDEGTPHKVRWEGAFARIDDDGIAISADHAYDFNGVSATVPSVVSEVSYEDITFTDGADMDSLAAGEMAILRICRNHDHADDNATGDAELQLIAVRET